MTASPDLVQLAVRIPARLKEELEAAAKEDGRTLANLCIHGLQSYLEERFAENWLLEEIRAKASSRLSRVVDQINVVVPRPSPPEEAERLTELSQE